MGEIDGREAICHPRCGSKAIACPANRQAARVIAATSSDLEARVKTGKFRQDLCLLLNGMQIKLPPLRDRRADIPLLVDSFVERYARHGSTLEFSHAALNRLLSYDWPGNVRELEHTVQRAVSMAVGPVIEPADLTLTLGRESAADKWTADEPLLAGLQPEIRAILSALHEADGDRSSAATMLGIGPDTLHRRLRYHGLEA